MQIQPLLSLAACALTFGAAAAQSAPRVLQVDEVPAAQVQLRAPANPSETAAKPAELRTKSETTLAFHVPAGRLDTAGPLAMVEPPGSQEQGFLGVRLESEGDSGATVSSLVDGSPAALAGVQAGDRIVAVDGAAVARAEELIAALRGKPPGTEVTLTLERAETKVAQKVTLGVRGGSATAPTLARPVAPDSRPATTAEPAPPPPPSADTKPRTIELRTLDVDGEAGAAAPKRARVRVIRPGSGGAAAAPAPAQGEARSERRVEVRAESQEADGKVRVWVDGEEVDPGEHGGVWVEHVGGGEGGAIGLKGMQFQVEGLEDLEGLAEQIEGQIEAEIGDLEFEFEPLAEGQHMFRFESSESGDAPQGEARAQVENHFGVMGSDGHGGFMFVTPNEPLHASEGEARGQAENHFGVMGSDGHGGFMVVTPKKPLRDSEGQAHAQAEEHFGVMGDDGHGGFMMVTPTNPLQRRVDELEGQVRRLDEKVRELERALDRMRGGDDGAGRERGRAGQQREHREVRERRRAEAPRVVERAATLRVEGQPLRAELLRSLRAPAVIEVEGHPLPGRAGDHGGAGDNDELRREIRDLMQAIERLERRTGGR